MSPEALATQGSADIHGGSGFTQICGLRSAAAAARGAKLVIRKALATPRRRDPSLRRAGSLRQLSSAGRQDAVGDTVGDAVGAAACASSAVIAPETFLSYGEQTAFASAPQGFRVGADQDVLPGRPGEHDQLPVARSLVAWGLPPPPPAAHASGMGSIAADGCAEGAHRERSARAMLQSVEKRQLESSPPSSPEKQRFSIMLAPSAFPGRPPVLFFRYERCCSSRGLLRQHVVKSDAEGPIAQWVYAGTETKYAAIVRALTRGGISRGDQDCEDWILMWTSSVTPELLRSMRLDQRVNHFPGSEHLGRKDNLCRHLSAMRLNFGCAYDIAPVGFVMPLDALDWMAARSEEPHAWWIWKPCNSRCGRNISIIGPSTPTEDVEGLCRRRGVVQRYIANPLLIDGFKFDLRVYVVVLSYEPLKIFLFDEGLVRLATQKYSADADTLGVRTMHLTNYSVNKLSPDYESNMDSSGGAGGASGEHGGEQGAGGGGASKRSFCELREHFRQHNLDYDTLFDGVRDVIIKTLIAVQPQIRAACACAAADAQHARSGEAGDASAGAAVGARCFELYGFDVMVDAALKPWLLEVNVFPSLRSDSSPLDRRIKTQLVADMFTLVGLRPACLAPPPPPAAEAAPPQRRRKTAKTAWPGHGGRAAGHGGRAGKGAPGPRAAQLASLSPRGAVALFDEAAWDMVMDAHDEDQRAGGLERIFPTASTGRYCRFLEEESYADVMLRKWHEAGGYGDDHISEAFLPPGLPRPRPQRPSEAK